MDYSNFFNTYGFIPPIGFDTREKQLKDAGINAEGCLMYGYGYYDCENPPQPKPKYLTFTANEDGSSVGFIIFNDGYELPEGYTKPSLQYSIDGGKTWQDYDLEISNNTSDAVTIGLDEGESIMFKGVNENLSYYLEDGDDFLRMQTYIEGSIAASGDVTSLLNGIGGDVTLAEYCYSFMFYGCTGLTTAPALPATKLADNCYNSMFINCTGLTTAPALPATTLADSCYSGMFISCTGLTTAPSLSATTLAIDCYTYMFSDCTGLTTAPALPATTLADSCYSGMFYGCTGLTTAPALPATTLAEYCYSDMFSGCTSITSHDVATLNNSRNTFQNNSSCASLTIHADTPPTIINSTITGLKADCVIYVPAASVDAYKAARYWSTRAAYIQAIP